MSEPILDLEKAEKDHTSDVVYGYVPIYDKVALEAQAQAAVDNAMELKHGDLYENFRQARFRYERAEAKLARVRDYVDEDFDLHTSTIRGLLND